MNIGPGQSPTKALFSTKISHQLHGNSDRLLLYSSRQRNSNFGFLISIRTRRSVRVHWQLPLLPNWHVLLGGASCTLDIDTAQIQYFRKSFSPLEHQSTNLDLLFHDFPRISLVLLRRSCPPFCFVTIQAEGQATNRNSVFSDATGRSSKTRRYGVVLCFVFRWKPRCCFGLSGRDACNFWSR